MDSSWDRDTVLPSSSPEVPEEVPEAVRETFARRLAGALRGDEEALAEVQKVIQPMDQEVSRERRGLKTRCLRFARGTAGAAWSTFTSWSRMRSFVLDSAEKLIIETMRIAFDAILTVPLGVKFTGDTARMGAFQIKAVLYYLNGQSIPEKELQAGAEYTEEAKRIASYLATFGVRAGLFALPGIGVIASATVGKWLEGQIRTSFADEDPKVVTEIRSLLPR